MDAGKLGFAEKRMLMNVQASAGDYGDLEAITAWVTAIAGELQAEPLA